jgi:hypothetical protein
MLRQLFSRQPVLVAFACLNFIGLAVMLVLQHVDPRQLDGVEVWVKPAKFFLSVGVYSLTLAWFFGYVREDRRGKANMQFVVWASVLLMAFENFWITWQAGHAVRSHFNTSSTFAIVMYSLMGVAIITTIAGLLVLAWEITWRPIEGLRPDYQAAVVLGLVLTFFLGGGLGGYMSQQPFHTMGAVGGHFPVFGWNRQGGDLRVAHFFGMHIMQFLPILMAAVAPLPKGVRWGVLGAGVISSVGVTVFVFIQALNGQPFLPGL